MQNLIYDTVVAYVTALEIHFKTVGKCWEKHKATEEAYESLFDVAHSVAEKNYSKNVPDFDDDAEVSALVSSLSALETKYSDAIKSEKDEWVKNVLIQALDSVQQIRAKLNSVTETEDASE